jgi:CheY-like chemotaxis protein
MTIKELTVTVLVVEDDLIDMQAARRALESTGRNHRILSATNGREGLDVMRREFQESRGESRMLVLLDLQLPELDGKDFLREKGREPDLRHIPSVVLTTSGRREDVADAYQLGAAGYFTKPVGFPELSHEIASILEYWSNSILLS